MKFLSDALETFARTFFGALGGAIAMYMVIGGLDQAFQPRHDDLSGWAFYAIPIGVIFGGATAYAYAQADKEWFSGAAWTCFLVAIPFMLLHLWPFASLRRVSQGPTGSRHAVVLVFDLVRSEMAQSREI